MGSLKELAEKLNSKGLDFEYIEPQKPEKYELHSFVRFYLSNQSVSKHAGFFEQCDAQALNDLKNYIEKTATQNVPFTINETEKIASLLRNIGDLNEQTYTQFGLIKDILIEENATEFYPNVIELLYNIFETEELSSPVVSVLFNNFGLFFVGLRKKKVSKSIKQILEDKETLTIETLLLTVYATPKTNINTWENDFGCSMFDNIDLSNASEGKLYEEYEHISEMVVTLDSSLFELLSGVKYLPYCYSEEDVAETLVGNFITIKDKSDPERNITYQIVRRHYFNSYEEMFYHIKPGDFGFPDVPGGELSAKCKHFFANVSCDEKAMALYVIKLDACKNH